jgi:hypothetical protein
MAKLRHVTSALFIILAPSFPPVANAADLLGPSGFGNVKVGMTIKQAERALGAKLNLTSDEDPSGRCLRGSRADGIDPGVVYMALNGSIQRIDVELASSPSVRTPEGIGLGATPKAVLQAYGGRAQHDHTDYAGDDDLVVNRPDRRGGVQFTFQDGKLAWMLTGNYPALSLSEGCL